jgi:methionyl-tRNA formyltransferase
MVSVRPLRIVYFGTPEFAVPALQRLLESRHEVVALVSQPDRPKGRGHHLAPTPTKVLALARRISVLQPEKLRDEGFLRGVAELSADLGVVAAYGRLLPDPLLRIPRLGMINVHASLLPRWRGAAPVHRAVIAGDEETGVTIMRVVRELDAGPMFAAVRRSVGPDETSVEIERDLAQMGASLLVESVDALAEGRATETPQDGAHASYAPKIAKEEGAIDWELPAPRIHNLVRGLQPWPLVSARLGDLRVIVHRTALTDIRSSSAPRTVDAAREHLDVTAGDGRVIRILQIQPEGRRVMAARAFLAGRRLAAGTRIERA